MSTQQTLKAQCHCHATDAVSRMDEEIQLRDSNRSKYGPTHENKTAMSCENIEYDTLRKNTKIYTSRIQDTYKASDESGRQRRRPRANINLKITKIKDVNSKKAKGMNPKRGQQHKEYKESHKRIRRSVSVHENDNMTSSFTICKKARKNPNLANENAAELPITDILRKSKEVRSSSKESMPHRELTTDTLYIQRGDADFSAVKISEQRNTSEISYVNAARDRSSKPIDVSIVTQKAWRRMSLVYQGLLGGLGLMHFILVYITCMSQMQTFFECNFEFIETYSNVSEIYANVFAFLTAMCLVSSLDRYDAARLDGKYIRKIYDNSSGSAITIPIYLTMLCLHQATFQADEKFSLMYYYNATTWTHLVQHEDQHIFLEELGSWQRLTVTKDSLAFIAWIFTCIGTRGDLLLIHLEAMQKYAKTPRIT